MKKYVYVMKCKNTNLNSLKSQMRKAKQQSNIFKNIVTLGCVGEVLTLTLQRHKVKKMAKTRKLKISVQCGIPQSIFTGDRMGEEKGSIYGAWQAAVHGVAKSRTQLRDFTFTLLLVHIYVYSCAYLVHNSQYMFMYINILPDVNWVDI